MSFNSKSIAKILLVAVLGIGSTSGYLGHKWAADVTAATSALQGIERSATDAKRAGVELGDKLKPDVKTVALADELSSVILDIFNKRLSTGVTVSTASPGKVGGAGAATLDSLAEMVPGTNVQSVRVDVRGSYSDYKGFLAYIDALKAHQLSIVHLKVKDQSFELGLRVYGELSNS